MVCIHFNENKRIEILETYRQLQRYSLLSRNKHYLKLNKRGKELDQFLKQDNRESNQESGQSMGSETLPKKRKSALKSGMENIIQSADRLVQPQCFHCGDFLSTARLLVCLECVYCSCLGHVDNSHSHSLFMDFCHLNIYCRLCQGYVDDLMFDEIITQERYNLLYLISRIRDPLASIPFYKLWKPSVDELAEIEQNSTLLECAGIRGLWNLGSTCFMNSILQVLLHNPIVKAFFLGGKHCHRTCPNDFSLCMPCQLDNLFEKFSMNEKTPVTPHEALHCMWISQKHMAGYSQQDAHEYFISLLDQVHKNSFNSAMVDCPCIIHKVFGGFLQSEVTCTVCNNSTCTDDPFLDLSLEIKKCKKKKVGVLECIEEYTLLEKLNEYHSMKQLSIKQLPPVLCIQLKRFEHSNGLQKIKTEIKVPFFIDMTPYTSRHLSRKKKRYDSCNDGVPLFYYTLYAVVCHTGGMENGHYKSFVKVGEEWLLFDDQKVTKAGSLEFGNDGYMLFYQRCFMDYVADLYQ